MPAEIQVIEKPAGATTEAAAGIKPIAEINATDITPPPASAAAAAPAKKGSAKESIFSDLKKRFGEPTTPDQDAAAAAAKASDDDEPEDTSKAAAPAKADDKKPAKQSPWKVVEEYKTKTKQLEEKLLEYEKKGVAPEKIKQFEDEIAKRDAKIKEYDEEMRYVNYQKTQHFKDNYEKPYEQSWEKAMSELSEITVMGDEGERAIKASDILDLVNLPLREAKSIADERFGEFSSEVMQHRKEIRNLFEKRNTALEEARKNSETHMKSLSEQSQKRFGEITETVKKEWAEANHSALSDEKYGTYFKPVDGDEQGNQRLAKGYELADRAFSENPLSAKTSEERKAIIQRHAAVRNRCAAFGRLAYQNQQMQAKMKEMEARLSQYGSSEPERTGSVSASAPVKTSAKQSIGDALRKLAK